MHQTDAQNSVCHKGARLAGRTAITSFFPTLGQLSVTQWWIVERRTSGGLRMRASGSSMRGCAAAETRTPVRV